jgi:omega-6 fatty acid desaturase (delta-12 desaturase)
MAVYTFVHHTAEDIPLFSKEAWNAVRGQFHGTANCRFPSWISFCHHSIDVHIPHHLSVNIPCYHLSPASRLLQESRFGESVREFQFSWRYLLRQIAYCLLYDPAERTYRTWDALPKVAGAGPSK